MPSAISFDSAVKILSSEVMARWPGTLTLDADYLKKRFPMRPELAAGWRLPNVLPKAPQELIVAVNTQFPWSLPIVALPEPTNVVTYPHVERDGHICVVSSSAVYQLPVGLAHVEALVVDALDVLEAGSSNSNVEDFFAEAQSYWSLIGKDRSYLWLVEPAPNDSRVWAAMSTEGNTVVASSNQSLKAWAAAAGRPEGECEPALMLRLPQPLEPKDYPLKPADLISLAERIGAGDEIRSAIGRWKLRRPLRIVISFTHLDKTVLLGAQLPTPGSIRIPGSRGNGVPGFRSTGRRPAARIRALCSIPLEFGHLRVVPIYREFLHERTAGAKAQGLRNFHVLVIGCGALGGQIAVQLVQAGVGELTLLDDETFDWRNVGRHVLDGKSVGQNKAQATAKAIGRRFPDADVHPVEATWEEHFKRFPKLFDEVDLIVSATAETASNRHLDQLSSAGVVAPVVFGWLEPFAVSSHAIFRHPSGAGLKEITDDFGLLLEPVTDRDSAGPLPQEASCGAFYQPYSALSSLSGVILVAELVVDALIGKASSSVHRIWVSGADDIQENGLSITPVWHARLNEQGFNRRYEVPIGPIP